MTDAIDDPEQRAAREWLHQVLSETGLSATALAKKAGLAVSTLTRFLNRDVKYTLSARTIARVAAASGIEAPLSVIASARQETDQEVLQRALYEARLALGNAPLEDRDRMEAQITAQAYDVLIEAGREGRSLEDAARTLRSHLRRQGRNRR